MILNDFLIEHFLINLCDALVILWDGYDFGRFTCPEIGPWMNVSDISLGLGLGLGLGLVILTFGIWNSFGFNKNFDSGIDCFQRWL